ncbi:efflux RND transporter permease subunit [Candidatus Parcubacteria bacterium]|nr:efflux RND transporter permease subunit [Candidatus Parcubacteria bacterium]
MLPLWNFFIAKRQFTALLIAGLVIWGVVAVISITKESSPEVSIPVGIVSVALPGGSAEDVERLVTHKLEERLGNLPNLDVLTSSSQDGLSIVTAQFLASADLDKSIQKLKDEVDKVKSDLPEDATDPVVSDVNFVDQPIQIISITTDRPFSELANLGEQLKSELQGVKGVSRVEVSGVRDREIQVVVKKEEIARLSISLAQITSAIARANSSLPVGAINVDNVLYNISFQGSFDQVQDIGSVPILNVNNQVIYLRDIATVSDGVQKASSYSRISVGGKPSQQALTLAIFKVRGQDVNKTTTATRQKIDELKKTILAGSDVVITNDLGEQVQKDLSDLTETGFITMILVMLCLFATIGWREAIIAGLSIPLSFLIAFIGLLYTGNTLNFISLFSLILAIGILVDSGIVVVEAIHTRRHQYGDKVRAAREALQEYAWPLIGGTMTTIAVFLPLFFISGIVGQFISSIPYTVIFVLIASIFVALGLVPALAIAFAREESSDLAHRQEEYAEKARAWYAQFLHTIFENRKTQNRILWGMVLGLVLAFALPISGILKTNFFPQEDIDFLYVDIEMPPGTPLAITDLTARAVEETLYDDTEIESLITSVGGLSSFGNAAFGGGPSNGERFANITVTLPKDRKRSSTQILEDIKKRVSVVHTGIVRPGQPSGGPPVGAAIDLKYLGENRDVLDQALAQAGRTLAQTPGATEITASNKNDSTQFVLTVDRNKLASLGLSPAEVAGVLRTAIAGNKATTLTGGAKDVDVMVTLNLNPNFEDPYQASQTTLDAVRQIPLTTPSGTTVLLGSVINERLDRTNAVINHEDKQRLGEITANVAPGYTPGDVLAAFNKNMEATPLPEGVHLKVGGENEQTNQSFMEMFFALIGGIGLMFVILVLSFNSLRFSGYLLSAVPLSLIGVFGGLTLTGQTLSFSSLLGIIALAGVIINHAIILMDSILRRVKDGAGKQFKDIVVESAVSRLRPIVLTTITTVIGMIPLIFVSPLWGPLAFAILFGLSFSMTLTLLLIPILVYRWPGKLNK